MASCGVGGVCYVRNDRAGLPFSGTVTITAVSLATGAKQTLSEVRTGRREAEVGPLLYFAVLSMQSPISLPAGPGAAAFFTLGGTPVDGTRFVLVADVVDSDGTSQSSNLIPLAVPSALVTPKANVQAVVAKVRWLLSRWVPASSRTTALVQNANPDGSVNISLTTDAPALWFTLTTLADVRVASVGVLAVARPCSGSSNLLLLTLAVAGPLLRQRLPAPPRFDYCDLRALGRSHEHHPALELPVRLPRVQSEPGCAATTAT